MSLQFLVWRQNANVQNDSVMCVSAITPAQHQCHGWFFPSLQPSPNPFLEWRQPASFIPNFHPPSRKRQRSKSMLTRYRGWMLLSWPSWGICRASLALYIGLVVQPCGETCGEQSFTWLQAQGWAHILSLINKANLWQGFVMQSSTKIPEAQS